MTKNVIIIININNKILLYQLPNSFRYNIETLNFSEVNMKAVVFDNSGTLIKRYKAIKDLRNGVICDNVNSIDIVDHDKNRALVVLQTDPFKMYK